MKLLNGFNGGVKFTRQHQASRVCTKLTSPLLISPIYGYDLEWHVASLVGGGWHPGRHFSIEQRASEFNRRLEEASAPNYMSLSKERDKLRKRIQRKSVQPKSNLESQAGSSMVEHHAYNVTVKGSIPFPPTTVQPKHTKPVPYPTDPTPKQSREWEDYKTKLRK